MINLNEKVVLRKNPDYSTTILPDGKWLFFDSGKNEVVVVSPTAGVFWEHCSGNSSLSEIIARIAELYPKTEKKKIRNDVHNVVPLFIKHNLVESLEPLTNEEKNHGKLSKEPSTNTP